MHTTAATHLRTIRDRWTELRALIDTSTPAVWPPATGKTAYLRALETADATTHAQRLLTRTDEHGRPQYECAHCDHTGDGHTHRAREHRGADQLAETTAPLRLHVVDTCRAIEAALASLCDEIAAEVQRSPITPRRRAIAGDDVALSLELLATKDSADPARWHYTLGDRSAPAAASWLLARWYDEAGPFLPLGDAHRARITRVARGAVERMLDTLGAEQRSVALGEDRPCPWCGGVLTMHRDEMKGRTEVTCATGWDCTAPVPVRDGRREWATPHELDELRTALDAAERRARRRDAKRAERERRRVA
ncbi:hypothetical protein [Streptomyces qinglanensis]|uniref:hypothetical protein n=1 Tax=Streptomyces qinglanensis TaxID=943816 RepID=UPI003D7142DB